MTILSKRYNYSNCQIDFICCRNALYQGSQTVIFEDQRNQFTKLRLISKMRDAAFLMRN